jgi:hypothetical protein
MFTAGQSRQLVNRAKEQNSPFIPKLNKSGKENFQIASESNAPAHSDDLHQKLLWQS